MNDVIDLLAGECPALGLADAEHAPVRARGVNATIVYRPTPGERRPLEVLLAIVTARHWHTGLNRAGAFGAYCPRALMLGKEPADISWAAVEADLYRIGLIAAGRLLVAPEPFGQRAYSPAGDRFVDSIHRQVRQTCEREGVQA